MAAPRGTIRAPARRPCATCPYRRDVPSGVWAPEEYEKLRRYDAPTMEQPPGVFVCHTTGRNAETARVCAGWAGTHDGPHLLALRIAAMTGTLSGEDVHATIDHVSPDPLFASGAEAADHGMSEVNAPGPRALVAMSKVHRVRSDLITPVVERSPEEKSTDGR
ncbi:DUF6283 family protein [Thermomonospora umbrina]|uniref:Uncharacterized protein n=1 Tax=Thermomonospora umbrina TaxID=111806 RepID=A0A3D9T1Z6_9ACTN|nr:DUF6283 family protein [Thermomonospora umbrina]REF00374.1 hypothetical protein DFJ69_5906 [Thermomonospora umbrina]